MWEEDQDNLLYEVKNLKQELRNLKQELRKLKQVIDNQNITQQELLKQQSKFTEFNLNAVKLTIDFMQQTLNKSMG